jgi:hypothetical protein
MKKTFIIPVVWQSYGKMRIVANTLEEAKEKAINEAPLPEGDYIEDSIELDEESVIDELNQNPPDAE